MNEAELVRGCVDEDRQYQALLYQKYANKMYAVCLRYCNTREEAEDVLQDAFVKIFDRISSFRGDGPLEGWIRRVMVNTALKSRDKRMMKFESGDIEQVDEPQVDEQVLGNIQVRNLLNIVSALPEGYRMVFNLYAVEGYSHKEIGDILGISESTSRSQYSRARKLLIDQVKRDSTL
ncbi:MAG: sigma-70 family RNA polymerase sigma factor [Flavobacteriales bacterium]|nr:sigma-70 family RNA polymerase sigma factor [Flavobacteriales bacterium]